jgi:hypothetical protein
VYAQPRGRHVTGTRFRGRCPRPGRSRSSRLRTAAVASTGFPHRAASCALVSRSTRPSSITRVATSTRTQVPCRGQYSPAVDMPSIASGPQVPGAQQRVWCASSPAGPGGLAHSRCGHVLAERTGRSRPYTWSLATRVRLPEWPPGRWRWPRGLATLRFRVPAGPGRGRAETADGLSPLAGRAGSRRRGRFAGTARCGRRACA